MDAIGDLGIEQWTDDQLIEECLRRRRECLNALHDKPAKERWYEAALVCWREMIRRTLGGAWPVNRPREEWERITVRLTEECVNARSS